ncbi:MAG: thiosulfate/3-mercaptopyruvate sulfurtransferase [Actinomycetota bacterium]|nr:thiosulfate/3-mercaptopyruvate sulfurtransferase [Actinomycetota bacterium]
MVAPIVDASWLADHPEAVLADVRWYADGSSGLAAYEHAHLPGAVFVDLDRWLAAPPTPEEGRHPLPDPEVFAEGMRQCGIGDGDTVVAYDDDSGAIAARLVWMLRVTGHDAALLDGGITGWRGRREQGSGSRPPASFSASPWPVARLATIDEVSDTVLLDARPADRFRGENETMDPRPGHVPGARSLPCRDNSDARGVLLPVPELRARLAAVGVAPGADWVSSCGSGVTACHTLLVAEHLGLPPGRLYPGSWSQWAATDRPAALGAGES